MSTQEIIPATMAKIELVAQGIFQRSFGDSSDDLYKAFDEEVVRIFGRVRLSTEVKTEIYLKYQELERICFEASMPEIENELYDSWENVDRLGEDASFAQSLEAGFWSLGH